MDVAVVAAAAAGDANSSSGYEKPPWIFKGSALYQLHLVKSETARAFIPQNLKLVEAFGYTLGGLFLANYDDSPAGPFDELVVIAGIIWNPPTSCAWAARVLVNSDEACAHGRKEIGLPSRVANFSKRITAAPRQSKDKSSSLLSMMGLDTSLSSPKDRLDVQVMEIGTIGAANICNVNIANSVTASKGDKWFGPAIRMSLPSFSGCTEFNSNLLKYSCKIECRVRVLKTAEVSGIYSKEEQESNPESGNNEQNMCVSVLLSKPILALQFNCLRMQVEAPAIVAH